MKVEFEGGTYDLDTSHVKFRHALEVQRLTGMSFDEWSEATVIRRDEDGVMVTPGPEYLHGVGGLYWLMHAQSGDELPFDTAADLDFDVSEFMRSYWRAYGAFLEKLLATVREEKKPDPTRPRPRGRKAAPTESREQSSPTDTTPENSGPQESPNGTESGPPAT